MKIVFPAQQMHREQQTHQAQVVVSMQVADEDVVDFVNTQIKPSHLQLAPFAAIDEKMMVMNNYILRGSKPSVCRQRAA